MGQAQVVNHVCCGCSFRIVKHRRFHDILFEGPSLGLSRDPISAFDKFAIILEFGSRTLRLHTQGQTLHVLHTLPTPRPHSS